jgi:hypothetical protein
MLISMLKVPIEYSIGEGGREGTFALPTQAITAHPELIVQDLSWLRERARAEVSPRDAYSRGLAPVHRLNARENADASE